MALNNAFGEEDLQLVALMREIESFRELEPNTVAFLSTKVQNIRNSLKEKSKLLQKQNAKAGTTKPELKKPFQASLADRKKKEYFF